jgi:hypothetical protein
MFPVTEDLNFKLIKAFHFQYLLKRIFTSDLDHSGTTFNELHYVRRISAVFRTLLSTNFYYVPIAIEDIKNDYL